MVRKKKAPKLTFQQHVADYLVREHKYAVLEQSDITDTAHFIAEDQLCNSPVLVTPRRL